jgi:hypothetical protein
MPKAGTRRDDGRRTGYGHGQRPLKALTRRRRNRCASRRRRRPKPVRLERALGLGAQEVNIKRLHDAVVQKVDATNLSFWAAENAGNPAGAKLGLMQRQRQRQRLKLWFDHADAEIAAAGV